MQEGKPKPKLTSQNDNHHDIVHQQGARTEGAGPSMPLPRTEADYAALPVVEGPVQAGSLVAYKLLEIGPDWAPQVFAPANHFMLRFVFSLPLLGSLHLVFWILAFLLSPSAKGSTVRLASP